MNRVSKMSTFLFKIGGNALSDAKDRRRFCDAVSTMIDSGTRVIIVHGGGPEINKALEMKANEGLRRAVMNTDEHSGASM